MRQGAECVSKIKVCEKKEAGNKFLFEMEILRSLCFFSVFNPIRTGSVRGEHFCLFVSHHHINGQAGIADTGIPPI